jgi:uncharacterized membrane protein YfcA
VFHNSVNIIIALLLIAGGIGGARLGLLALPYVRGAFFRLLLGFFILGIGVAVAVQAFIL